jgi:hypothetical protein
MSSIIAVINLDCIGGDNFLVTKTETDHGIDLDQVVMSAAGDLGVDTVLEEAGQADETPFLYPAQGDNLLMGWWGTSLGTSNAHPVKSSVSFLSSPLVYREYWDTGEAGWIHTSYDNSTSTSTLNWVRVENLGVHIKIAALTLVRVSASVILNSDINKDGKVNMVDVTIVAKAFGTVSGDSRWDETADLDNNGTINIVDVSIVAKDFGKGT